MSASYTRGRRRMASHLGPVLVTGSAGRVGCALTRALPSARFVAFDLPEHDARSLEELRSAVAGCRQIVHLAWDQDAENHLNMRRDPSNVLMAANVLRAAADAGCARVVLASSIHAASLVRQRHGHQRWPRLVDPREPPRPLTPYGASKVEMESLGRKAASGGLDVIVLRFGAVGWDRRAVLDGREQWLHPRDFEHLMRRALHSPVLPGRFEICYGVSRHFRRQVALRNGLGWRPLWFPSRRTGTYGLDSVQK